MPNMGFQRPVLINSKEPRELGFAQVCCLNFNLANERTGYKMGTLLCHPSLPFEPLVDERRPLPLRSRLLRTKQKGSGGQESFMLTLWRPGRRNGLSERERVLVDESKYHVLLPNSLPSTESSYASILVSIYTLSRSFTDPEETYPET